MKYLTLTDIYGSPVDSKLIYDGELNIDALVSAVTYAITEKWQVKLSDSGEEKGLIPTHQPVIKEADIPDLLEKINELPTLSLEEVNNIVYGFNKEPSIQETIGKLIEDTKNTINKQPVKRNKKK